jgi:DNA-binding response OmpR family regulator
LIFPENGFLQKTTISFIAHLLFRSILLQLHKASGRIAAEAMSMTNDTPESRPSILIVEDDPAIGAFVQTALEREGFKAELVKDGEEALERVDSFLPNLILLDLMLPGMGGLEVCQALRRRAQYSPIIMLTAKDDDVDKIVGLEMGADDYITKPFKIRELLARVRALLRLVRHSKNPSSRVLQFGSLEINSESRTVRREQYLRQN